MTLLISSSDGGPKIIKDKYLKNNFTDVGFHGCRLTSATSVDAQNWSYKCKPNNEENEQIIQLEHDTIILSDDTTKIGHYCPRSKGIGDDSCSYMECNFNRDGGVFYLENKKRYHSIFNFKKVASMF